MSKITRAFAKLFASTAGSNQIAEFGSFAASAPQRYSGTTVTPALVQALGNWSQGWAAAVEVGNSPAIEDMNGFCYVMAYQIAYQMQTGVPEWDATTTYYKGSCATATDGSGTVYISITDTNLNNAVTDATNWVPGGNIFFNSRTQTAGLVASKGNIGRSNSSTNAGGSYSSASYQNAFAGAGSTFLPAAVNTSTNVITLTSHGLVTSQIINFTNSGGGLPSGLAVATDYWTIVLTANTFKVATTYDNAVAGTAIALTTQGTGTHSLRPILGFGLTTSGRSVSVQLQDDGQGAGNSSYIELNLGSPQANLNNLFNIIRIPSSASSGTSIAEINPRILFSSSSATWLAQLTPSSIQKIDLTPAAASYTYKIQVKLGSTDSIVTFNNCIMLGIET